MALAVDFAKLKEDFERDGFLVVPNVNTISKSYKYKFLTSIFVMKVCN